MMASTIKTLWYIAAFLLLRGGMVYAQTAVTSPAQETSSTGKLPANTGIYTGLEVFGAPNLAERKDPEPGAKSYADGFIRDSRQHLGVSVSAFETYIPDAIPASAGRQSVAVTSVLPQIYTNFQTKKLDFRLTYGINLTRYSDGISARNRSSQIGTAAFSYTLSRRKTMLVLSNDLSSWYYDESSYLGSASPNLYRLDSSPQFYTPGRRQNRSLTLAELSYNLAKKSTLNASLGHDTASYSEDIATAHILTASFGTSYQISKQVYLKFNYSHYLNIFDKSNGANTENFDVLGFVIKPARGWEISSTGGIESTKTGSSRSTTGGVRASVARKAASSTIEFSYHRGFSSVLSTSELWSGDTAGINLVQSLSRRINVHVNASYIHGSALITNSSANTLYGGTGLDFAFQDRLVLSSNYFYISQQVDNTTFAGAHLHRNTISVGLQYYLPSLRAEKTRRKEDSYRSRGSETQGANTSH